MSTITYIVKVVSAQFTIDDAVAPKLTFRDGDTYIFDQADSSNAGHILQFSITSNNSGSSEYSTGVTKTGTPGSAGAKTTIVTSGSTTDTLYYYSSGGGTYGSEFSNTGYTTTSGGLLKPIVGGDATAEKWGSILNHSISQIGVFIGSSYIQAPIYADDSARDTAIPSPATGMLIYNTNSGAVQQYNGVWSTIAPAPNITAVSGFLNDDSDSTITVFGTNFTASSAVKMFDVSSGGSQIGSNATTTFNSNSKLTAVFGAGSIGASGSTAYIEVDNVGATSRFATAITVNADPTVTNVGATGAGAVNHATNSSTHLGTYGGATAGGPTDSNTVLLLNFDRGGGTDFEDSSNTGGDGHKVAATAQAKIKASPFGDGKTAMKFDGSSDYLSIADHADFSIGTNDFTLEFWVNLSATQSWKLIAGFGVPESSSDTAIVIGTDSGENVEVEFNDTGGSVNIIKNYVVGKWYHFAISRQTSGGITTGKAFVDGIGMDITIPAGLTNPTGSIKFGSGSGDYTGDFNGYLDEIRFVNGTGVYRDDFTVPTSRLTAITNTKLLIHSNLSSTSTTMTDSNTAVTAKTLSNTGVIHSTLYNHAESTVITPAMAWPASGKAFGSTGAYFDGDSSVGGDKIFVGTPPACLLSSSKDWTIEFWFNYTTLSSTLGRNQTIFRCEHVDDGTIGHNFRFYLQNAGNLSCYFLNGASYVRTGSTYHVAGFQTTYPPNTWHHWAFTHTTAGIARLYVNGKYVAPDGSTHDKWAGELIGGGSGGLCFGGGSSGAEGSLLGYIDQVRVSDNVRYTGTTTSSTWSNFSEITTLYGTALSKTIPTITFTGSATQLAGDEDIEFTSVANTTKSANNQHLTDSGIGLTLTNYPLSDATNKHKATLTGTIASDGGTTHTNMPLKAQVRKTLATAAYADASRVVTFSGSETTAGLAPAMPVTGTGIPASTTITTVDTATTITLSANPTGGTLTGQSLVFSDLTRVAHVNGAEVLATGDSMLTIATGAGGADPVLFNARRFVTSGVAKQITGYGFKPDMIWQKRRDATGGHTMLDSVRGVMPDAGIYPDSNVAQGVNSTYEIASYDSDGYTTGTDSGITGDNYNFVAWAWKAGGAPSASALSLVSGVGAGTISNTGNLSAITQSVSQTSGFSISKYVGAAAASSTNSLPHNLGAKPDWVIIKSLHDGANWMVWHTSLTAGYNINLNNNAAQFTHATNGYIDGATTNTTTISIKGGSNSASWVAGAGAAGYICYAWAAVAGVSHFGTYEGTGGALTVSGLGFSPSFLLIKNIDNADNWMLCDKFRGFGSSGNADGHELYANADYVEYGSATGITVSNGQFVMNTNNANYNYTGHKYIYAAFA